MDTELQDPELDQLVKNKEGGFNYRERRHPDWRENYTLYRDKITINRLTQRQSVNIPLMKQTIRTLLKDVDDMPVLYFENLDSNKQAEMYKNEYWNWTAEQNNMELLDIIDKKQVFLFGRSFDQWQIVDGKVKMTIQDPQDMLTDRYCDPADIHSSRFLIHTHIYVPLSVLRQNPDYDQEKIDRLLDWYQTTAGIVKQTSNEQDFVEKSEKMADLGLEDVYDPTVGEPIFELSLHFVMRKEPEEENEQIYLYVEAENMEILMKKPLEQVIGRTKDHFWRNHYPYNTWADDLERQDFWSDSIADIVRQPNNVLNAWFSQLVENRTLRNFGMHYYDSTIEGFVPASFEPIPWGWYGLPGKPSEVLQKIDIPDLSESLDEMQFVIEMLEKATGATTTQQGAVENRQITLGEVQLALGEAKERIKGMSKFYTKAWKDRGLMFLKLVEAGADKLDPVMIHKSGRQTNNVYTKEISPKDWITKNGYYCKIWSQEEKNSRDTDTLQKLNLAKTSMPMNQKLDEVYKRKVLEFADLPPADINEIMKLEQQQMMALGVGGVPGVSGQVSPGASPVTNQMPVAQARPNVRQNIRTA